MNSPVTPNKERKRRRRAKVAGGRQHSHRVLVTAEEEGRLSVLAEAQRVTIPRLLIESALAGGAAGGIADRRVLVEELFSDRRLLANVANNLNQLTRHAHATGALSVDIDATLTQVRELAEQLSQTIESVRL